MNFFESINSCFRKYFIFKGKSSRSEFWYFFLFCFLISSLAIFFDFIFFNYSFSNDMEILTSIVVIFLFIPYHSVGTRRLHDINKSGLWILIGLTGIGQFLLLYWWIKDGVKSK